MADLAPADLEARVIFLRREVRRLKALERTTKHALRVAASELTIREAECHRYGIPLAPNPPHA